MKIINSFKKTVLLIFFTILCAGNAFATEAVKSGEKVVEKEGGLKYIYYFIGILVLIVLLVFALFKMFSIGEEDEPETDGELVLAVGARKFVDIGKRYSSAQLEIMYERELMKMKMMHWEMGYRRFGRVLLFLMFLMGTIGYVTADHLEAFISVTKISRSVIWGLLGVTTTAAIFNVSDLGRMWAYFYGPDEEEKKILEKKEDIERDVKKEKKIMKHTKKLLESKGGMSNLEIIDELELDISPQKFGALLKEYDFEQIRTNSSRVWVTKKMKEEMEKSDEPMATQLAKKEKKGEKTKILKKEEDEKEEKPKISKKT